MHWCHHGDSRYTCIMFDICKQMSYMCAHFLCDGWKYIFNTTCYFVFNTNTKQLHCISCLVSLVTAVLNLQWVNKRRADNNRQHSYLITHFVNIKCYSMNSKVCVVNAVCLRTV